MDGKWEVQDVKDVFETKQLKLQVADIELPDKSRTEHAFVTLPPAGSAMAVASIEGKGTLMVWRHRFVNDAWTWELPGARIEERETATKTAGRALLEQTGWQAGKLRALLDFHPWNEFVDGSIRGFTTNEAKFVGGERTNQVADIAWLDTNEIRELVDKGDISDGRSLTLLLYALSKNLLK